MIYVLSALICEAFQSFEFYRKGSGFVPEGEHHRDLYRKIFKLCEIYIPKQCSRNRGNRKRSSAKAKTKDFLLGSLAKVLCLSSIIILSIFLISYPCESARFLDVIDKLLSEYF